MTIDTVCPHCGKEYEVAQGSVGKSVDCVSCGKIFSITDVGAKRRAEEEARRLAEEARRQAEEAARIIAEEKRRAREELRKAEELERMRPSPAAPPPLGANMYCTNCGGVVPAETFACLSCGASPTGHRKFCRRCGESVNPAQVVCLKCGARLAEEATLDQEAEKALQIPQHVIRNSAAFAGKIRRYCSVYVSCTICASLLPIAGVLVVLVGSGGIAKFGGGWESIMAFTSILSAIGLAVVILKITSVVFYYMLLYKLWEVMPETIAKTTPGRAVGFCFIPLFKYYWQFIALYGLGEDMNKTLQQYGFQLRVNQGLGMLICIFNILVFWLWWVPVLGIVLLILPMCFMSSVKNGALALLDLIRRAPSARTIRTSFPTTHQRNF